MMDTNLLSFEMKMRKFDHENLTYSLIFSMDLKNNLTPLFWESVMLVKRQFKYIFHKQIWD